MLILDTTTRSLTAVLSAAVSATELDIVASYVDITSSAFNPATNMAVTSGTTPVTVVGSPGSSTQRQVKYLSIYNNDNSFVLLTLTYTDSTGPTSRIVWKGTLQVGDQLQYTDGEGFVVIDSTGQRRYVQSTSLAGLNLYSYQHVFGNSGISRYQIAAMIGGTAITTGAPSADTLRALPIVAPARGGIVDLIGFQVTTLLAGNARVGLYTTISASNLYPDLLLADTGDISTGTTGFKSNTITNITLIPGALYWLVHCGSSAATIRCLAVAGCAALLGSDNSNLSTAGIGLSASYTYGALPSTFPSGAAIISAVPIPALAWRLAG